MDQLPFFVYGTLRRGEHNHPIVEDDLAGAWDARLPGHLLYAAGLPYIAACGDVGQAAVTGDLLLVEPARFERALRNLDHLEGYDPPHVEFYVRTRVRAEFRAAPGGAWQECDAWAYLGGTSFACDPRLVIASGDWTARRAA